MIRPDLSRMRPLSLLVLASIVSAGCEDTPRTSATGFAARDSAGIRIAENRGSQPATEWTLSAEPLFTIGADATDPGAQLHNVTSATRRSNGEIVVANSGTSEILIFDSAGRRVGVRGRKGEGPGEFSGLGFLSLVSAEGDSIITEYNSFRSKLVRFDSAGRATEVASTIETRGGTHDRSTSSDGVGFYLNHPASGPDVEGAEGDVVWIPGMLVRFSYDGEGPDTVARYRGVQLFFADIGPRMAFGGGSVTGPSVLSPLVRPEPRSAGGGDPWRVIAGDQGRGEFDVFSEEGALLMRVRWDARGREFAREDAEQIRADFLADHFGRREPQAARRALDVMPPLERSPVYEDLHVDRLGAYWAKRYPLPGDSEQRWWVFNPDGRLDASVAVPLDLRIMEVGEDYLLGVAQDELDVQRLELWGLRR